jgi:hypothetical protein
VRGQKRVEGHPGQVCAGEEQDHFLAAAMMMVIYPVSYRRTK